MGSGDSSTEQRAEENQLPVWARVLLRVLFREGPMVVLAFLMAAVIMGLIPSPYLGKPLADLKDAHDVQTQVSRDTLAEFKAFHQEFSAWRNDGYRRQDK